MSKQLMSTCGGLFFLVLGDNQLKVIIPEEKENIIDFCEPCELGP